MSWTRDEDAALVRLIGMGTPVAVVARRLGKAEKTVYEWALVHHGGVRALRGGILSQAQTAQVMGVHVSIVRRWIKGGLLVATRSRRGRRRPSGELLTHYAITPAALTAFLRDRNTWMAWHADDIVDPVWRQRAQLARRTTYGHWLTPCEVGARLHYDGSAVREWIRRGYIVARRWGACWYVWSFDLDGFTPPIAAYTPERRAAATRLGRMRRAA